MRKKAKAKSKTASKGKTAKKKTKAVSEKPKRAAKKKKPAKKKIRTKIQRTTAQPAKKKKKGRVTEPTLPRGARLGTRDAAGRPGFEPTDAQRGQVRAMSGLGIHHTDIAAVTVNPETGNGISTATLHKHFKPELSIGRIEKVKKVADKLYAIATTGKSAETVRAAIFFLKARAGWTEKVEIEHTADSGVLVVPATVTPQEWVAAQLVKNAERSEPTLTDEVTASARRVEVIRQ